MSSGYLISASRHCGVQQPSLCAAKNERICYFETHFESDPRTFHHCKICAALSTNPI